MNRENRTAGKRGATGAARERSSLLGRVARLAISLSAMVVLGVGAGLYIRHMNEKGTWLNPLEEEDRKWARETLEDVRGKVTDKEWTNAKWKDLKEKVSGRVMSSKEEIEKWLKSKNERIPDTQELLSRAIEYLERPVEKESEPIAAVDAGGPEKLAGAAREAVEEDAPAVGQPGESEPAKAVETAGGHDAREPVLPRGTALWSGTNPTDIRPATGAACEWDDPACAGNTVETTSDTLATETVEAATGAGDAGLPAPEGRDADPVYVKAREHYEKGLQLYEGLDADSPEAGATANRAAGEFRKARKYAAEYVETHPDDKEAGKFLVEIERLLFGFGYSRPAGPATAETKKPAEETPALPDTEPTGETAESVPAEEETEVPADGGAGYFYSKAEEHFRKGLEHYRESLPGTPREREKLAAAEKEFREAQAYAGRYLDLKPDDAKAEEFFVEINRFLYDCLKRKVVDVR
ncbi:MAG: hypothetical protein JW909_13990 [Planctomycetes bacterium]|nr:hypothetical protein [Planctomycetota bacterium]